MGLTSPAFLWLVIALAAGSIAGTVWVWPKLARQAVVQVVSRLGLIVLSQLLIIAAVLTYDNDSLGFYTSWPALFGTGKPVQPVAKIEGPAAAAAAAAASAVPITITGSSLGSTFTGGAVLQPNGRPMAVLTSADYSGAGSPIRVIKAAAGSGVVLRVTIHGEFTGIVGTNDYVYLPLQYFQAAYADAQFPVLLAFTGYPNDPVNLMRLLQLPAIASKLAASGRIGPAIIVMVNPSVALPRDTECTNIPAGLQVANFFGRDVPLAVERTFRAQTKASGWATLGYSTGAYCATKMAMLFPRQFSAAISLSGYYVALQDRTTGNLYGGSIAYRDENDLTWRLRHLPAPPVAVVVATSASGEKTLPGSQQFLRLIHPPMLGYSLILRQGGHNYYTWRRELPQSLEWLSRRLTAAAPAPAEQASAKPTSAESASVKGGG